MKVLIWYPKLEERSGGPATYLYNLRRSVIRNELENKIFFSADVAPKKHGTSAPTGKKKIMLFLGQFIKRLPDFLSVQINFQLFKKTYRRMAGNIDFTPYDVVHFHASVHLYMNIPFLKDFKGKVILTTHSPKAPHQEVIEDWFHSDLDKISRRIYRYLEQVDKAAIQRADGLIFPCNEALEPYQNTWPAFDTLIKNKKITYCLTASLLPKVSISREEIRKKYNIPENAFVVTYAGRHNEVKGYDQYKNFGKTILEKYHDVYFLNIGKEGPLYGLEHSRWHEAGWTSDPHSIMAAADLFVLSNKQTYFDLILLEALGLGNLILMSRTGGNKYFEKNMTINARFYKSGDTADMINAFDQIRNIPAEHRALMKRQNENIFKNNFSIEAFALNYLKAVSTLN